MLFWELDPSLCGLLASNALTSDTASARATTAKRFPGSLTIDIVGVALVALGLTELESLVVVLALRLDLLEARLVLLSLIGVVDSSLLLVGLIARVVALVLLLSELSHKSCCLSCVLAPLTDGWAILVEEEREGDT